MSWPFTDSATTLIGTTVTAVLALIGVVWAAKIGAKNSAKEAAPEPPPRPAPPIPAATASPARPIRREQISDVEIMDIVTAVEAVKPMHRDAVHANYVGLRVRWLGTLRDINRGAGTTLHVTVDFREGQTLGFCRADANEVTGLEHADEGTPVEVIGTINEVLMKYEVTLEDCVIRKLSTASPSPALAKNRT